MSTSVRPATRVEIHRRRQVIEVRFVADEGPAILSSRVLGELGNCLEEFAEDTVARFVVFRGSGGVFLAGGDIRELAGFTEDHGYAYARHGRHVVDAIEALPQITIAAINGHALGSGCGLCLACDVRVMARHALIGHPETRMGLTPCCGALTRLPRLIGESRARRLLYAGESLPAEEALQIGLVDEVVADAEGMDTALQRWFDTFAPASPAAAARVKRAMLHNDEVNQFGLCFSCSDAREGVRAFLEHRAPEWATSDRD